MNEMVESLRYRVTDMQQAQALLRTELVDLQEVARCASQDEIMERIKSLIERGNQLGDTLGAIHIES